MPTCAHLGLFICDNSIVLVGVKPLMRNPGDAEYAYVSHERNSLLEDDVIDLTIQKESVNEVESAPPVSPEAANPALPLLDEKIDIDRMYAKPDKASPDGVDGMNDLYENVTLPGSIDVDQLVEYVESKRAKGEDGFAHDFGVSINYTHSYL